MKQTAVNYLIEQLKGKSQSITWNEIFDKAKEMEKEQIIDAWNNAAIDASYGNKYNSFEQYYDEQFKKK